MAVSVAAAIFRKCFLVATGVLALYLFCAVMLSALYAPAKLVKCDQRTTIYLRHSPVHVDVVFPTYTLSLSSLSLIGPGMQSGGKLPNYIIFGLGDRDIFLHTPNWKDIKLRYALKAGFLPSARAMHIEPSEYVYTNWIAVEVCENQLRDIERYVMDGFTRDDVGGIIEIEGVSYTGQDRFYEANGSYHMFNTCNNWANGALKAGGLKASLWAPFAQGVVYHGLRQ